MYYQADACVRKLPEEPTNTKWSIYYWEQPIFHSLSGTK